MSSGFLNDQWFSQCLVVLSVISGSHNAEWFSQ